MVLAFAVDHDVLQETVGLVIVSAPSQPRIGLAELLDLTRSCLHPSKWYVTMSTPYAVRRCSPSLGLLLWSIWMIYPGIVQVRVTALHDLKQFLNNDIYRQTASDESGLSSRLGLLLR
jgi:hypothetical protein